jgi:putative peptide zinc metalloprotease protein
MTDYITHVEQRVSLLKNLELMENFPLQAIKQLACLFKDVVYPAGSKIIDEHEIIDSVFVIVDGHAEGARENRLCENKIEIVEAFSAGETIGLDDPNLFAKTHLRTETVTAVTPVFAIRLELKILKQFLQSHPELLPEMNKSLDHVLAHAFIKKLEPFEEVSHALLAEITPHIKTINLPAETIIFRQGDIAECCYLLCSGTVDVIITKKGVEESIATIEPGELLGEMALFTGSERNATLKTMTPCQLMIINGQEFQQLICHSPATSSALTSLLMDRHRPLRQDGITIHTRLDAEKNSIVIFKNAENGTYVKTSEQGLFVWHFLDGDHTLQDIAVAYYYKYHKLATETIGNLVLQLMRSGFVKSPLLAAYVPRPQMSKGLELLAKVRNVMQYEYAIKNVDGWITRLYQRVGFLFFTPIAKILMALIVVVGFGAFIMFLPEASSILKNTPRAWLLLLLTIPANIIAVPLHELAHALTTKAYGYQVHRLGIGWFWLGPIAFADTSDMWLSTRGPRIAVNLAGIYVNVVISGMLTLVALCLANPVLAVFFRLVALSSYLMAFYNLDPMFELDGYYVLMDMLDKPNLRGHAIKWLVQDFKKTLFNPALVRGFYPEILYWITSIGFIFAATFMAYIVQTFVFNNIFPETIGHAHPSHYKWLFSTVVIILSFASLYAKVRQQMHQSKL